MWSFPCWGVKTAGSHLNQFGLSMMRTFLFMLCLIGSFPLSAQEMPSPVPLPQRIPELTAHQKLVQQQRAQFRKQDTSEDESLSLEEMLAGVEATHRTAQEHRFRICDADGSGDLSFPEYRVFWAFDRAKDRDAVPDVVRSTAMRAIKSIGPAILSADTNQDGQLSRAEWEALTPPPEFPAWIALQPFANWDEDRDGLITPIDVHNRLHHLYGLHTREGILLRPGGAVLNWKKLVSWDSNLDRQLTRPEFIEGYWAAEPRAIVVFQKADSDENGVLSFAEVAHHGMLETDMVQRFASWDQGAGPGAADGQLSYEEMRRRVPGWERKHLRTFFDGADQDKNGQLSLKEYLASPWGMPLGDWFREYKDTDGDLLLSWPEFLSQSYTPGMSIDDQDLVAGPARIVFESLQFDADEMLTLQEFAFSVQGTVADAKPLARILDLNDDGRVSFSEAFEFHGTIPPVPVLSWFDELFASIDENQDKLLSAEELAAALHFQDVITEWQRVGRTKWEQFQNADFDSSGEVGPAELAVFSGQQHTAQANRLLQMLDFDQSAGLSFEEFLCLPGNDVTHLRGQLPDPVNELIPELLAEWQMLLQPLDLDGDGRWSAMEWRHRTDFELPGPLKHLPPPFDLGELDTNADRIVTADELRAGLDVLMGLRTGLRGVSLRRPTGLRFSINRFADDVDARLHGVAFAAVFKRSGMSQEQSLAWCTRLDANGDHVLSLEELLQGDQFWHDPVIEFIRLDTDMDARLSAEELTTDPRDLYRSFAASLVPAFDIDDDGTLSFREYLGCPLTNPLGLRPNLLDADSDGLLQPQEYFGGCDYLADYPWLGKGYLAWAFDRWDRDGSNTLSLSEWRFRTNLRELPEERLFEYFDQDADGQLTVEEAVRREPPAAGVQSAEWADYQKHAARVEEAFLTADSNGDRRLARAEFEAMPQLATQLVPGRKAAPVRRPLPAASVVPAGGGLSRRAWLLIGFNVLLLTGLGWLLIRK